MTVHDDRDDATAGTARATASAAHVAGILSEPLPDAARALQREHERVVSENALDEALRMTFPASDPVAL